MSFRAWTVAGVLGGLTGCGSCTEEATPPKMQILIEGGAPSAEGLLLAWYQALEEGDIDALDTLSLSAEQRALIYDCSAAEVPEKLEKDAVDLRARMESEIGTVAAELAENGAHFEFESARALQHIPGSTGDEVDGCELLRGIIRHKIRSIIQRVDSIGSETQEMRFAADLEVDGAWFLVGMPGPMSPGGTRAVDPKRAPQIGPQIGLPIRGRNPTRIKPPSVEAPGPGAPAR